MGWHSGANFVAVMVFHVVIHNFQKACTYLDKDVAVTMFLMMSLSGSSKPALTMIFEQSAHTWINYVAVTMFLMLL